MERTISVLSDVKDLGELLAGACIEQARCVPSGARLRLEIELTRPCRERPTKPPIPWVKSRLQIGQIKESSVQRVSEQVRGQTPWLSCDAIPGGYHLMITSADGLRFVLTLEQLNGQFADVGQSVSGPQVLGHGPGDMGHASGSHGPRPMAQT